YCLDDFARAVGEHHADAGRQPGGGASSPCATREEGRHGQAGAQRDDQGVSQSFGPLGARLSDGEVQLGGGLDQEQGGQRQDEPGRPPGESADGRARRRRGGGETGQWHGRVLGTGGGIRRVGPAGSLTRRPGPQAPKSRSSTAPRTPGCAANREPAAGSSPSGRFSLLVVMNNVDRSGPPKVQAVTCRAPTAIFSATWPCSSSPSTWCPECIATHTFPSPSRVRPSGAPSCAPRSAKVRRS